MGEINGLAKVEALREFSRISQVLFSGSERHGPASSKIVLHLLDGVKSPSSSPQIGLLTSIDISNITRTI